MSVGGHLSNEGVAQDLVSFQLQQPSDLQFVEEHLEAYDENLNKSGMGVF